MSNADLRFLQLPDQVWDDLTWPHAPRPFRYVVKSTGFTQTWRTSLVLIDSGAVVGAVVVRRYRRLGHNQDELEFIAAEPFSNGCNGATSSRRFQSDCERI